MLRSNRDQNLDAVADSSRAIGVRRTTRADVARRAGLSRSTLYTHFTDVRQAAAALLTRELVAMLSTESERGDRGATARQQLVEHSVAMAGAVPDHPLIERILEVDAELLVPYLVTKLGSSQRAVLDTVQALVVEGQADGSVRDGDPSLLSFTTFLITQSFVISARIAEAEHGRAAVLDELALVLDRALSP